VDFRPNSTRRNALTHIIFANEEEAEGGGCAAFRGLGSLRISQFTTKILSAYCASNGTAVGLSANHTAPNRDTVTSIDQIKHASHQTPRLGRQCRRRFRTSSSAPSPLRVGVCAGKMASSPTSCVPRSSIRTLRPPAQTSFRHSIRPKVRRISDLQCRPTQGAPPRPNNETWFGAGRTEGPRKTQRQAPSEGASSSRHPRRTSSMKCSLLSTAIDTSW